ncbi:2-hydroxyacid dehydrogenase [uncultured Hyphomonas sp.]|uniref:2-hydroxyacid dehydrogenase n=1 Tax=uncultured Hyphomonas sp. TaxID=225298 RepID=UPI002AAB479B|nr:2-hydroxyacid dehydrogenase [uncultured Hyphomonas sp.]
MIKVLFHYEAGPNLLAKLDALKSEGLDVICCDQADDETFEKLLPEVDALWHVLRPVTSDHIAMASTLKLIQKIGVGVNTIDLESAKGRDIPVCNMPGTNTRAVAEMTLLLILSALRIQPRLDALCRSGQWIPDEKTRESLQELHGKTVGLIGFGDIPGLLAPILEFMGAKVIYTSRSRKDVPFEHVPLDQLISRSDIVSLHIPLNHETAHTIGADQLARMKPGAVLINTARGGLVDETALYAALRSGHLKSAGLDVFDPEPAAASNPLLQLDNVIPAPHVAWLTNETFDRSLEVAVANTLAAVNGQTLRHRVT